jgi:hypothetical protein
MEDLTEMLKGTLEGCVLDGSDAAAFADDLIKDSPTYADAVQASRKP